MDLVEIARFRQAVRRGGASFVRRIFTMQEQAYAKRFHDPMPHLAARFAAKEAAIKALSQVDPTRRFDLTAIEVESDALGRPSIHLHGAPHGYPVLQISLTHTEHLAAALAFSIR